MTALYHALVDRLGWESRIPRSTDHRSLASDAVVPAERERYLAEIARAVRQHHADGAAQAAAARRAERLRLSLDEVRGTPAEPVLAERLAEAEEAVAPEVRAYLAGWSARRRRYEQDELVYAVRGREVRQPLVTESLSRTKIPRVSLPRTDEPGAVVEFMSREGVPGEFPYTAGVFPLKRTGED